MREFDLTVSIRLGLFARACGKIVETIKDYETTDVYVTADHLPEQGRVNAKSILNLMMFAATFGTHLHFELFGPSEVVEQEAEQKLQELFNVTFPRLYNQGH
jgi:phosphotransferase system HPr (HPr) family protein